MTWWSSSKPALSPSHMPQLAETAGGQPVAGRQADVLGLEPCEDLARRGRGRPGSARSSARFFSMSRTEVAP